MAAALPGMTLQPLYSSFRDILIYYLWSCVHIEPDAPSSFIERNIVEANDSSMVERCDVDVQEVGSTEEAASIMVQRCDVDVQEHMEHVITRDKVMEIEWDLEGGGGRGDGDDDGGAGPRPALPSHVQHRIRHDHQYRHLPVQHCLCHLQHRLPRPDHLRHVQHHLRHVQDEAEMADDEDEVEEDEEIVEDEMEEDERWER
ncbi:hypothetical protein EMCRGX_G030323 [Ephydatia muelleri]